MPDNVVIEVCPKEKLKEVHSKFGAWDDGILGFAINNENLKFVFAKENNLDILLITIGHELGHVVTGNLKNRNSEEAKAFAFEIAWAQIIHEHNVAGLRQSINLDISRPANNGLHNLAFEFVKKLLKTGKKALEIYFELAKGIIEFSFGL